MRIDGGVKKGIGIGVIIATLTGALPLIRYVEEKWDEAVELAAEEAAAEARHRAEHEYAKQALCELDTETYWYKGDCLDRGDFSLPAPPE